MAKRNGNGRPLNSQHSVNTAVKSICDVMRRSNCAGALQYVPELTWILFLRILDEAEEGEREHAEAVGAEFRPSLESPFRWRDWAAPYDESVQADDEHVQGWRRHELEEGTLGEFFGFVNGELLPHLRDLKEHPNATPRQKVISEVMSGVERVRIDTEKNFRDVLDKMLSGAVAVPSLQRLRPSYSVNATA